MADLNALILNEANGEITIAVGATGRFTFILNSSAALVPGTDMAVFGIGQRNGSQRPYTYGKVFRKDLPIEVDAAGTYFVTVALTNADTRALTPGKYYWDITVVTDPVLDSSNLVKVDESTDNVYPIYASTGNLPGITILGGVPIV